MSSIQVRLVKHPRGKWLWATCLDADEWHGAHATLEDAINDGYEHLALMGETTMPIYVAHGRRVSKAECEEWGVEWPWYQVDPETAIRVRLPSAEARSH